VLTVTVNQQNLEEKKNRRVGEVVHWVKNSQKPEGGVKDLQKSSTFQDFLGVNKESTKKKEGKEKN